MSDGNIAISKDQVVPTYNDLPTVKPIRTEFFYSNVGYELIAQGIERVSNTTFETLLKASILEPLGMRNTFDSIIPEETTKYSEALHYATQWNFTRSGNAF